MVQVKMTGIRVSPNEKQSDPSDGVRGPSEEGSPSEEERGPEEVSGLNKKERGPNEEERGPS